MIKFKRNVPIGKEASAMFVTRLDGSGGFETHDMDKYSEEDIALGVLIRDVRLKLDLSLRETARLLECSVVDLSSVERGRLSPESPVELAKLFSILVMRRG